MAPQLTHLDYDKGFLCNTYFSNHFAFDLSLSYRSKLLCFQNLVFIRFFREDSTNLSLKTQLYQARMS
jgi:hypothetical protein